MLRLALFSLLCTTTLLQAQPTENYNTEWLKEPYQFLLVIYAEPHPLLTNVYVEHFARDLGDSLQRDLGRTAKVSTLIYREGTEANTDPARQMMQTVIERGWGDLDNLPKQIQPNKVHLVRLYYIDGEYEVQSRQVDGETATVSTLRKSRTTDRHWVTRLAALQVAQDFGHVGEVTEVNNQTLRIQMQAAGLGVPETIRMVQGEVMALVQVRRSANGYTASRLQETLAYITNVDAVKGLVTARLFSRLSNPLAKDRQTVTFRAIKLGTKVVPLQLRVLDQDDNPIGGYSVSHFPGGYDNAASESLGTTDTQGRIVSKDPIYHVAFVRVQIAGVGKTDAPVPLLDDQPVVIKISGNRDAAIIDDTKFEYERWLKKFTVVKDNYEVDYKLMYIDVMRKGNEKQAVDNLEKLSKGLKESVDELKTELERVRKAAQDNKDARKFVDNAESGVKILADSVAQMDEQVALERNPTEDRKFLKLAKQADAEYDFDLALENYKKSYLKNRNQPKVLERIKAIERIWKTQYNDKDHKDARTFAQTVWTSKTKTLTWEEIEKEIGKAEQYLDDLEKRGDYLTVLILIKGDLKHIATLNAAREALGNSEDVQEKLGLIDRTRKALIDFDRKARDFVEKAINEESKGS